MAVVLRKLSIAFLAFTPACFAQQPPVKVNVLNVCTPSADEQKEISAALARVPRQTPFSTDFEIARGRTSLTGAPDFLQTAQSAQVSDTPSIANWVRIRRDLPTQSAFSTVQYSFSDDGKLMVETLVLHVRDPKDLVQISIEDNASSVTSAATMLASATPASRIKLERFGKSSVVLARCSASEAGPAPDQAAYEPLFASASSLMTSYRGLLGVRRTVPDELARIGGAGTTKSSPKAGSSKPPSTRAETKAESKRD